MILAYWPISIPLRIWHGSVAVTADSENLPLESRDDANGVRAALIAGVRLALFRNVAAAAIPATVAVLLALALIQLALGLGLQVARVGLHGQFNLYELPRTLFLLPLALFCGLACAEAARDASLTLRIAVAASALSVALTIPMGIIGIAFAYDWLPRADRDLGWELWTTFLFWWAAALAFAIFALVRRSLLARLRAIGYGLLLLVAPAYWMPAGQLWSAPDDGAQYADPSAGLVSEAAFYAQHDLLSEALDALAPERPGVEDVYVLTAALFAAEDVFMKEVAVIADLLERRFDAAGRTLRLINNRATLLDVPIATLTSVQRALAAIGSRMNPAEDLLVLYLTSHGSEKHRLSVDLWPLQLETIDPQTLRAALDDAGIRWRVIVVSACYSGGYVQPLQNEHTLIITAASANRQSFGCGAASDFTYLAKALFDEELRKTFSFEAAFARAKESIGAREKAQGFVASEPQIFVGDAIRTKLKALEARLAVSLSGS
jgi:hypothetical protein